MRVWLDDVRTMPDGYDVHVRTAPEAIALLAAGGVTHISLDHDLGWDEVDAREGVAMVQINEAAGTGYDVACWIEQAAYEGAIPPLEWRCHSANPEGRRRIFVAMQQADRFWGEKQSAHPSEPVR